MNWTVTSRKAPPGVLTILRPWGWRGGLGWGAPGNRALRTSQPAGVRSEVIASMYRNEEAWRGTVESTPVHLFSFAFGQCSITIRRQIRQFVIERNTSINSTTDCPISKTDWTLVIVNWTLCTTFCISKSFGQWAVSFITLVRMWEVPCQTVWNECRIVLKICRSLRTMLKLCWMTNWNQISPNCYAHRPISLHQLLGEVPSFAPVLNQFWRLATSNCKKVY